MRRSSSLDFLSTAREASWGSSGSASREASWGNESWQSNAAAPQETTHTTSSDNEVPFQSGDGPHHSEDPAHGDVAPQVPRKHASRLYKKSRRRSRIYDDPAVVAGYASVPLLQLDRLPRGGLSLDTKAVGRIQFGVPPETIKDSMRLGIGVPSIYIIPAERFCREIGPALGINLAEFEFPAYFNYFMRRKQCTLVVDSLDAESSIRKVFEETLLGPAKFRNQYTQKPNEDEDFDPSFPKERRPNFYKESYYFRTSEEASKYQELTIDMLIEFCHFTGSKLFRHGNRAIHDKLGVPPPPPANVESEEVNPRRRVSSILTLGDVKRNSGRDVDLGSVRESSVSEQRGKEARSDGSSLDCVEEEEDEESDDEASKSLRRTKSDPNLKRLSLDSMVQFSVGSSERDATSPTPDHKVTYRRGSMESATSFLSRGARSRDGMSWADGASFMLASDDEDEPSRNTWMYSQAKWLGEMATVYPPNTTEEQKAAITTPRVEIFKMTGGTEYIVHDVDERNIIIGKARFSGTVRVPDELSVEGFLNRDGDDGIPGMKITDDTAKETGEDDSVTEDESDVVRATNQAGKALHRKELTIEEDFHLSIPPPAIPTTFHPPSFGVTVLGNSHGFDKNGSVSGYVLWLNGRGVMIDPPPYSSATLEREGIRPQMIVAIIITHCHADHDAGTFQKVMTGSRVAIITTPTIYKSFIRKYAALSGLNPTLLCHSHRHRPAIVGQPLRFQGAVFHFTYTLHTIPCIAFKVEWRGKSMVFTGDHLNNPVVLDHLEKTGVLANDRASDLRHLPLQECDVLLHEAGAPPIHTPLSVLEALPPDVKGRLYVVHTSALPAESRLRVAPTGTEGTIRIDQFPKSNRGIPASTSSSRDLGVLKENEGKRTKPILPRGGPVETARFPPKTDACGPLNLASLDDGGCPNLTIAGDMISPLIPDIVHRTGGDEKLSKVPPLVFLRPTCPSDAWFILNLLSAVPFLSSLSYSSTMEVLEIAHVEMFGAGEVVIPADRRSEVLCVVWEGSCVERDTVEKNVAGVSDKIGVDTTEATRELGNEHVVYDDAADSLLRRFNPTVWHAGDWTGPVALQPDPERSSEVVVGGIPKDVIALSDNGVKAIMLNMLDLHKILKSGSKLFRKYLALKDKQAEEEAAMRDHMMKSHGSMQPDLGNPNTTINEPSDEDQLPDHWNAYDSVLEVAKCNSVLEKLSALQKRHLESLAEGPRFFEAGQYLWRTGEPVDFAFLIVTGTAAFSSRNEDQRVLNRRATTGFMFPTTKEGDQSGRVGVQRIQEDKQLFNVSPNSEYARLEVGLQLRVEEMELDVYEQPSSLLPKKEQRMRNARDRFANKVLARLYSRRAFTSGLIFSRGHFLSDTSRMVSGSLAHIRHRSRREDRKEGGNPSVVGDHHCHTSNMAAGYGGCAVMVFPRSSLIQFLDGNPGVLLSLLGTQVVV